MKTVRAALLATLLLLVSVAPALAAPDLGCFQLYKAYTTASGLGSPGAAHIIETFNALGCTPP